ncbi:MAG: M14 family metallopeptidase [Bacteroidota bacterium]
MNFSSIKAGLSLLISYFILLPNTSAQGSFLFHKQEIPPASKVHIKVPITAEGTETFIPITIFHGKEKGPVLGITAGVHGYEYPPILASQKLIHEIDPLQLKGTVILVQISNLAGFLGRSPYTNPLDGKNLNRSFPGAPNGTSTDRIAHFISEEVIAKCDYFLDMHGGDAPEDLMPYSAYYQNDNSPEISKKGKEMAMHMGFDHIVVFKTTGKDYMKENSPSTYCSAQAFKIGIPSVDLECGKLGQSGESLVPQIVNAVKNLLQYLEMTEGKHELPASFAMIEDRSYLSSSHDGFFYPLKESGDYVKKGMKLGYITDFFNETVEEIYADKEGVILFMIGTPPIKAKETIAVIGVIKK